MTRASQHRRLMSAPTVKSLPRHSWMLNRVLKIVATTRTSGHNKSSNCLLLNHRSYLQSGQYSDLTIVDRAGRRWQVHKIIVCSECEFFANAIKGGFKVSHLGLVIYFSFIRKSPGY